MSTLREMVGARTGISAHCQSYQPICTHYAQLRLELLIQKFGWDFDIVDGRQQLRRRLVCSICGARWPGLIIAAFQVAIDGPVGTLEHRSDLMSVEESARRALAREQAYRERNAAQPEPYEWHGKNKGKGRKFGRR